MMTGLGGMKGKREELEEGWRGVRERGRVIVQVREREKGSGSVSE